MDFEEKALGYHSRDPRGKIAVQLSKPLDTQDDLATAYSPGVAGPCRRIHENQDDSFLYTIRGNLVGVISNGSAVLGLGNIGPYASKPVMEGKAMLFKKFANIDVFDIEVDAADPDKFVEAVRCLEPTFGGINLEDIKAPECFYIEEKLQGLMKIPVFHDDQHGTAIIAGAAFVNALELTGRSIEQVKVVFSGAGAAAIGCARLFRTLGVKPENLVMVDSKGVVSEDRSDLNEYKRRFAVKSSARTLEEALVGADAFVGVSKADVLSPEMLRGMAEHPIVFALSNPNPEIHPDRAREARPDVIIATGRSDFPNQVNNVLGFPYIFRGALDVRATMINEAMEIAAVHAIAGLAKEHVPEEVLAVYNYPASCVFGRDYLIPKPVDQRVLLRVAPAVAEAAMKSGVARAEIDIARYREEIEQLLGPTRRMIRRVRHQIVAASQQTRRPRILVTAGESVRMIKAVRQVADGGEVDLVLLGREEVIAATAQEAGINELGAVTVLDPARSPQRPQLVEALYDLRKRRGVSRTLAEQIIAQNDYFAATLLHLGEVDGVLTGINNSYRASVRPILEVIGAAEGRLLAGVYVLMVKNRLVFFADCTINVTPSPAQLAEIAGVTADIARRYTDDPLRIAMLSYANFGTSQHDLARNVARAVPLVRERCPGIEVDGEMQVDVALNRHLRQKEFPFCELSDDANILIFPDLGSANIGYKLLTNFGGADPTGPILAGLRKPANVLQRSASVQEIVNMIYVTAQQAAGALAGQPS